jgi:hypothetical protein
LTKKIFIKSNINKQEIDLKNLLNSYKKNVQNFLILKNLNYLKKTIIFQIKHKNNYFFYKLLFFKILLNNKKTNNTFFKI